MTTVYNQLMHIGCSGGAKAIKNDIPEFGFCLHFGGGTGGIASSAAMHATVAMTVSSPTDAAVLKRKWTVPLV